MEWVLNGRRLSTEFEVLELVPDPLPLQNGKENEKRGKEMAEGSQTSLNLYF